MDFSLGHFYANIFPTYQCRKEREIYFLDLFIYFAENDVLMESALYKSNCTLV